MNYINVINFGVENFSSDLFFVIFEFFDYNFCEFKFEIFEKKLVSDEE